jgi:hypothetical protein
MRVTHLGLRWAQAFGWMLILVGGLAVLPIGGCGGSAVVGPTCEDGIRNGLETDVDCGGPICGPCALGANCDDGGDCASDTCREGLCTPDFSCDDGITNGMETGLDCGGPDCDPCRVGEGCGGDDDCDNGNCISGTCEEISCTDGRRNAAETDVDCGGPECPVCDDGEGCSDNADCASGVCAGDGTCAEPTCMDGVQNGDESARDCGGTCEGCPLNAACRGDDDCESLYCGPTGLCEPATCDDEVQNGGESDVDCGGPNCSGCPPDGVCEVNEDCASNVCDANRCAEATCSDGVTNGTESDVDCGGNCQRCAVGAGCNVNGDCDEGVCDMMTETCAEPTCEDGVSNGDEIDVDCGGDCGLCGPGQFCTSSEQCDSGVCDVSAFECRRGNCADGVPNQDETGPDCGGIICDDRCGTGEGCLVDEDCADLVCDMSTLTCAAPTCSDGIRNGDELGIDCSGSCPDRCTRVNENFERGVFPPTFAFSGTKDWELTTRDPLGGTYTARSSSTLNFNETSGLRMRVRTSTLGGTSQVEFRYRVEASFRDNFVFLVNGSRERVFSNTTASGSIQYDLDEKGEVYTLEWRYERDRFTTSGRTNAAWVDDIEIRNTEPLLPNP